VTAGVVGSTVEAELEIEVVEFGSVVPGVTDEVSGMAVVVVVMQSALSFRHAATLQTV